jgi:DNA-binding XRE family transcriptional regulator
MNEMTIREIREEAGLTQQDMADKLGISRQQYASYEANPENVTIRQARKICAILGAAYERVFFGKFGAS